MTDIKGNVHARVGRYGKQASFAAAAVFSAATLLSAQAGAEITQDPLVVGGAGVPGNLFLVPSVEWPTINSVANLQEYSTETGFVGYFDSDKCYVYQYAPAEAQRHFKPTRMTTDRQCFGQQEWSGNFLNWAATQTIDPFRKVLTGGYRVRDTPGETWLEKARHSGQGGTSVYPNRRLPASGGDRNLVQGATPFDANAMAMQIQGLGNVMRFSLTGLAGGPQTSFAGSPVQNNSSIDVTVRVSVCESGLLESNCVPYASGHKPEGLIQQNADKIRFSIFGYLNDSSGLRDGSVLRARKKFVGNRLWQPGGGFAPNPAREWNPDTGVLYQNPNAADAQDTQAEFGTAINNSGVINYLNKFGQLTSNNHKSIDPVSELFYAATRYVRGLGNVPEYSAMTSAQAAQFTDGFPVITDWDDPILHYCQLHVALGIGDVNTHRDKNLPGSTFSDGEPARPQAVSDDTWINVVTATNKVGELEGLGNIGSTNNWSGRMNSAYLAGLAYMANTSDLREDLPGMQTMSSYWVDVAEARTLQPPRRNQYYLASKYGGFTVPEDFDPMARTTPLPTDWWHTNGEVLTSFGPAAQPAGLAFQRPDNFFLAADAEQMVEGLTTAFTRIVNELSGAISTTSVASNSSSLQVDSKIFRTQFMASDWSGELQARLIAPEEFSQNLPPGFDWSDIPEEFGVNPLDFVQTIVWEASQRLPQHGLRNIVTWNPQLGTSNGQAVPFSSNSFNQLSQAQQQYLSEPGGSAQQRINYLRGDQSHENQNGGSFRNRNSLLGDIINSAPVYVAGQDFGYGGTGADDDGGYQLFLDSKQNRTPMIYVGANDGMLHGFDANTGVERFAFVPNGVFHKLAMLTDPDYSHQFYVDATPAVADAFIDGNWRTVAVGALGAGGKSIFAIDVTDPEALGTGSVMWEFSHPDLGHVLGQPQVVRLNSGGWGVIVGNGYQSESRVAKLFVLDLATGSVIRIIDTGAGPDNGLSLTTTYDEGFNRIADRVYAGDLLGNVWAFDLSGNSADSWRLRYDNQGPQPLYVARDANDIRQPITAAPRVARTVDGFAMLFFGTGQYFQDWHRIINAGDPINSFYGIRDPGEPFSGRGELTRNIISSQIAYTDRDLRVVRQEGNSGTRGWYLDLIINDMADGERIVFQPQLINNNVQFTTLIPPRDSLCQGGSSGFLMELDAQTGNPLKKATWDLDHSGEPTLIDSGETDAFGNVIMTRPSGLNFNSGVHPPMGVTIRVGENRSATIINDDVFLGISEPSRPRMWWRQVR